MKRTKMGILLVLIIALVGFSAQAAEEKEQESEGYTEEQIAEMINNPLSNLWLMFSQNDTVWYSGDALDRLWTGSARTIRYLIPCCLIR